MISMPISEVREHLADVGNRVNLLGERVIIERRGKQLFALVPVEDVELIEKLEDTIDLESIRKSDSEDSIPWKQAKKLLGLQMTCKIEIKRSAFKELSKLPMTHKRRVAGAISKLAKNPRPVASCKLAGADDCYRIRVGNYRVVYRIVENVAMIFIIRVAHRKDVYRSK